MAGGERPAESESTDAEAYEFMAGEVTALADERAHQRFGGNVGRRPGGGGERPAESQSTDAESYEFMAGEVTALADERAHHRFGITVGPRPGVVAIHLSRYRLVGLAPQRPALAGFFGAGATGQRVAEDSRNGLGDLGDGS